MSKKMLSEKEQLKGIAPDTATRINCRSFMGSKRGGNPQKRLQRRFTVAEFIRNVIANKWPDG